MRLGVSTFSLTNEWLSRRYTLESLLRRIAALGPGLGLEAIGHQLWRGFPRISDDEVLAFRRLCDELELRPSAVSGYVDLLRRPGSPLTIEECVEELEAQIDVAERLGFPVIRVTTSVPGEALARAVPRAEQAGIVLATELQGPQTPDEPVVAALLELRERLGGTPSLGIVLDFSIAMRAAPLAFVDALGRAGMDGADVHGLIALWERGALLGELFGAIAATGAPAAAQDEARSGFVRFGRQDPAVWASLVPLVALAHAKFWELDASGDEPTTDVRAVVDVLAAGGFDGVVTSEWGGNAWVDLPEVDGFALVARHLRLLGRLTEGTQAAVPA